MPRPNSFGLCNSTCAIAWSAAFRWRCRCALRWLSLRRPNRQLSRTGLLEYHYEKYLYGDTCLFQLPERPRLQHPGHQFK